MKMALSIAIALFAAGAAMAQKATPAIAAAGTGGATPMRPGLWETTLVVETVGSNSRRTVVSRACYTSGDVTDVTKVLPKQREPGMKCDSRDAKVQGANASWQVACVSPAGTLAGSAGASLAATSYTGHAELERKKRGAKAEKVLEVLSGKWIEACK